MGAAYRIVLALVGLLMAAASINTLIGDGPVQPLAWALILSGLINIVFCALQVVTFHGIIRGRILPMIELDTSKRTQVILLLVSMVGIGVFASLPSTRGLLLRRDPVRISSILPEDGTNRPSGNDEYTVDITVSNPGDKPRLVTSVTILISESHGACAPREFVAIDISEDAIIVSRSGVSSDDQSAIISFYSSAILRQQSFADSGISVRANGVYTTGCGYGLRLDIPVAVVLLPNSYTLIRVTFPSAFSIEDGSRTFLGRYLESINGGRFELPIPPPGITDDGIRQMEVQLNIEGHSSIDLTLAY